MIGSIVRVEFTSLQVFSSHGRVAHADWIRDAHRPMSPLPRAVMALYSAGGGEIIVAIDAL